MHVIFWHSTFHPQFSGHALQMDRLRAVLRARGLTLEVWTQQLAETLGDEVREGVRVRRFGPAGNARHQLYLRQLRVMLELVLQRRHYQIFQLCGINHLTQFSALAVLLAGRLVVAQMTLMDSDDPHTLQTGQAQGLKRVLHRQMHRWVSLGGALTDAYRRAQLPPEHLRVIPVAVDLAVFHPAADRGAVRRSLGLPLGKPIVLMVGHVIRRKGYDVMVEAIPEILARVPEAHFVFVGPEEPVLDAEPMGPWIRRRALELGIEGRLELVGRSTRVREYLQAADVFAFPSRQEGLPNAVLEAAACGLPIVMSELPGVADELIRPGENGLIVPIGDAGALARHIGDLLEQAPLRARLGSAARAMVLERYDLERIADAWMALYAELAGEG